MANSTTDATLIGASLRTVAESTLKGDDQRGHRQGQTDVGGDRPHQAPDSQARRLGRGDARHDEFRDAGAEAADEGGGNRRADTHRDGDTCKGDHELIPADGEHNEAPEEPGEIEPQGG
jgi:hypothetical protein